jgi:hypothetical protein
MKIDKKLNLIVPVEGREGDTVFHSTPIFFDTFKKYHFVICAAFTKLLTADMVITGPKIAAMTLEEVAKEMGKWDGSDGVENGLMAEIARLTNVIVLTANGWDTIPVNIALDREYVSQEDWEEAKQRIVFFILVSAMAKNDSKSDLLEIMNGIWLTQTTLSTVTEFKNSLSISNVTGNLPKTEPTSSAIS